MRILVLVLLAGCPRPVETDVADSDVPADTETATPGPRGLAVRVTLDGVPVEGAIVTQGGTSNHVTTDPSGTAFTVIDPTVEGEQFVMAAHPEARIGGDYVPADLTVELIEIALERYDPSDNEAYVFQDPGEPTRNDSTGQCLHCHVTIGEAWFASPHRTAAKNPVVHDLYAGVAQAFADEAACLAAGGAWGPGVEPGTGATVDRCFVGDGTLQLGTTGACADCHAPGIDGELGGRDLLEARGHAYDYGVHCDVCHRVDRIEPDAPAGVAGRLVLLRPSEEAPSPGLGEWQPLTFGPWVDVANIRMGSVARDHFHDGTLCMGCHQHDQPVLVPEAAIDTARWPDGALPVHSTWDEWEASPYAPDVNCTSCHMPPDPTVGNGADLGNAFGVSPGVAGGWYRPPGAVRLHAWYGPRQPESGMHEVAAALFVEASVAEGELVARVTAKNVGCGHALPTGEPLRSMVLTVEASCGGEALVAVGGDAVPDFGGWLDRKEGGDWTTWPGAEPGDVVRVVRRTGAFHDYVGHGPFGDGTFDAAAKGLPIEEVVGEAVVVSVDGDVPTFDRALPDGDVAYRGRGDHLAGAPGFAFARVLVGADGRRMVPHFAAVDVASDNRLLPQQSYTTTHRFAATCEDPVVHAVLVHRAYPPGLVDERGWTATSSVMVEVTR